MIVLISRRRLWLCALPLLMVACGTRISHEQIVAGRNTSASAASLAVSGTNHGAQAPDDGPSSPALAQGDSAADRPTATEPTSSPALVQGDRAADRPTGPPQPGSPAVTQGDRRPIVIGNVGTLGGPAGATLKFTTDAVRVWVRWVNERGGIKGRPVELVVGDDGGDPARHLSLVHEFVDRRNVVAFVANPEGLTGAGSVSYLTRTKVPVVGSEGAGQWFYESPVYFPQVTHGTAVNQGFAYGISSEMRRRNFTKVATVMCVEAQICRDQHAKSPALFKKYGVELVYRAQVSIAQPDFTAECLNAQRAGAQVVFAGMDANSITRLAGSCARQGYRPAIASSAGTIVAQHRTDPNFAGALVLSGAQWRAKTGDATNDFQHAMAAYAPGVEPAGGHAAGWVAGQLFELAATRSPAPLTRQSLLTALWTIHEDRLTDITGPFTFNVGKPATPNVCGFTTTIEKGQWVPVNGGRRECTPYDPNI